MYSSIGAGMIRVGRVIALAYAEILGWLARRGRDGLGFSLRTYLRSQPGLKSEHRSCRIACQHRARLCLCETLHLRTRSLSSSGQSRHILLLGLVGGRPMVVGLEINIALITCILHQSQRIDHAFVLGHSCPHRGGGGRRAAAQKICCQTSRPAIDESGQKTYGHLLALTWTSC